MFSDNAYRDRQGHVSVDIPDIDIDILIIETRTTRQVNSTLLQEEINHRSYKTEDSMSVIWLDPDANEGSVNNDVRDKLDGITKSLQVLLTDEGFEGYVRQLEIGEQVILIVAGSIGAVVIPLIHDSTHVNVIYIYALQKEYYTKKFKKYAKVKEVIVDPTELILKIRQEQEIYRTVDENEISVNIYNLKEKSISGNQSDANQRFMWMYSFMDMLLQISQSLPSSIGNVEKEELVKKLRTISGSNEISMRELNKFEEEYSPNKAIHWYTRESPLYSVLNKALREKDLNLLLPFRFFISDIYKQLLYEHQRSEYVSNRTLSSFTVYRAQFMTPHTVLRIKNSINGYLSVNSFLSTSLNKNVVLSFIDKQNKESNKNLQSVLFEIQIDPNLRTLPYADISKYSMFSTEKEVLFSPGTILKIQSIDEKSMGNDTCIMRLKLCSEDEDELNNVLSHWKQNIGLEPNLASFGWLIMQTYQLDQVEGFYKMLLENLPRGDLMTSDCYNGLGNAYLEQNRFKDAINCHKKAIGISQQMANDQKWLAKNYSYLADAYKSNNETKFALKYYKKALENFEKVYSKAHRDTARCYSNIGTMYQKEYNYDEALESFEQALKLNEEINFNDTRNLITILKSLSEIHCLKIQFSDALNYLKRALKLCQKNFKTNDPEIGSLHEDIGDVHLRTEDFISALSSYHKAAEIYYYCYTQQEKHNLEIQHVITYCNIRLM